MNYVALLKVVLNLPAGSNSSAGGSSKDQVTGPAIRVHGAPSAAAGGGRYTLKLEIGGGAGVSGAPTAVAK